VYPKVGAPPFPAPALGSDPQQGFAYHIYCQPGSGDGPVQGLICDAALALFGQEYFPFLRKNPQVAGFMTEFGAVGDDPQELGQVGKLLGTADAHFQSWTYWQWKRFEDLTTANAKEALYDDNGQLERAKLAALSRTYAQAIAGRPQRMAFDPATAAFELVYAPEALGAPTEVYLNEPVHYPDGVAIDVQPPGCVRVARAPNRVLLHTAGAAAGCEEVTLRLTKASAVLV